MWSYNDSCIKNWWKDSDIVNSEIIVVFAEQIGG